MKKTDTWKNRTPEVTIGTYILKARIPNTSPDRRYARDWTRAEYFEPGEYIVMDVTERRGYSGPPVLKLRRVGGNFYSYELICFDTRFWDIYGALEKASFSPSRVLREEGWDGWGNEILDKLFLLGHITEGQLNQALWGVQTDVEAKNPAPAIPDLKLDEEGK